MLSVMATPEKPIFACTAPAADIPRPTTTPTAPNQKGYRALTKVANPKASSVSPDSTLRKLARPIST